MARTGKLRSPSANAFWETILLTYQLTAGTDSGAASAATWNKVPLNTEILDTGNICSLSSNRLTLPFGTYEFFDTAIRTFAGDQTNIRLYNFTDSAVVSGLICQGSYGDFTTGVETLNSISGRFVLPASKALQVEVYFTSARATLAWGNCCNAGGQAEVYGTVGLRKIV